MPANLQRFLPIILLAFFLLFVVPSLLHKHSSSKGPSSEDLSNQTIATMNNVDKAEVAFRSAHGDYTSNVADLLALDHALGKAFSQGIVASVNASTDGKTYYGQVASVYLDLVRARTGNKVLVKSCLVVKSGSGVACPAPPAAKTTTTTTTTTSTTTGQ
ncbi:MAG TPA: hypothetical protein VH063_12255 [Gaiellaceae bacterium]|jgi:hypothetical protein|nr:hypothetical protein [Gaiellaceae bacterium]